METYPTTLPNPTLASSDGTLNSNFIRSEFDYGIRQRKINAVNEIIGFKTILKYDELLTFKAFLTSINDCADSFLCDFIINGNFNKNKECRFIGSFTLNNLGANKYALSNKIEMIDVGTPIEDICPLLPSEALLPADDLLPC